MLQRLLNLRYLGPIAAASFFVGPVLTLSGFLADIPRVAGARLVGFGGLLVVFAAAAASAAFYWFLSRSGLVAVPRRFIWLCGFAALLHAAMIVLAMSSARGPSLIADLADVPGLLAFVALLTAPTTEPAKVHPRLPLFAQVAAILWAANLAFLAVRIAAIPILYPALHRQYVALNRAEPNGMIWIWLRGVLLPVPSAATVFLAPFGVFVATRAKHDPEPEA